MRAVPELRRSPAALAASPKAISKRQTRVSSINKTRVFTRELTPKSPGGWSCSARWTSPNIQTNMAIILETATEARPWSHACSVHGPYIILVYSK